MPQVIAAAYPVSLLAGQTATLVKLVRVLMLGPLVVVLSLRRRRVDGTLSSTGLGKLLPWFVVGFMFAGAMRSAGAVTFPSQTQRVIRLAF